MIVLKKLASYLSGAFLFSAIALFIVFSREARSGALNGIKLCESVILPSLLPLLIISNLIMKSRARSVIEAVFGRALEKLFRLPRCASGAVLLGLTGGYPAGAVLTSDLFEKGLIDRGTAKRIMSFNFSGGFAFIITAVGSVIYKSSKTGLLLFLSSIASSLIILALTAFKSPKIKKNNRIINYLPFSEALTEAVESSVLALAFMSAYIIIFSSVLKIINPPQIIMPFIEITTGICVSDNPLPLEYCAFFLSFGGICIHFQLSGMLKKMKIPYSYFLITRTAGAGLSFLIMKLLIFLFPQAAAVSKSITGGVEFSSGNLTFSLLMIIGCAVIVFDIENRKIKLI